MGAPLASALTLALVLQTPALAKPVPRGTVSAAEATMKQAQKDAEKGKGDKAVQQAEKAIDMVAKAGGPDAPELIPLRASEADVAKAANDPATERRVTLDGARLALAGPPKAPGVDAIEAHLEAKVQAEAPEPSNTEGHEIARTLVSLLKHEGVRGGALADAYKALAMTSPNKDEEHQAFLDRIDAVRQEKGVTSPEAIAASLDSANVLIVRAEQAAEKDPTSAIYRVGAARLLLGELDPQKVDKHVYAKAMLDVGTADAHAHSVRTPLSTQDADHAIEWLQHGAHSLEPLTPETAGDYANLQGAEAVLYALTDRVSDARDRYRTALEAVDSAHKPAPFQPKFLQNLRAFIDTPIPGSAITDAKCLLPGADAGMGRRDLQRCADMSMVRDLAEKGRAVAVALGAGLEKSFDHALGVAACAGNDVAEARKLLDVAPPEEGKPVDVAAEYEGARVLVMCDVATAEKLLTHAIENDTTSRGEGEFAAFAIPVWKRTGEAHRIRRVGDLLMARADKVDPSGAMTLRASLSVGEMLAHTRDTDRARSLLSMFVTGTDKNGAEKAAQDRDRAWKLFRAHLGLAQVAVLSGDLASAATSLEHALEQADQGGAGPDDALKVLVLLARIDRDRRDTGGLAKVSARALAMNGSTEERERELSEIGRILEEGDPASARTYYETRSAKDPSALIETARLYASQGDHRSARSMLENAYSQDPKNMELDCVLMGELVATGEPGAAGLLRDKLVREIDPTTESAPRSLGCLIDGLARGGHIADSDSVVQRVYDAEERKASAAGKVAIMAPLEAAWAYRAAGDAERTAKWGALYQRALDDAALGKATVDTHREVPKAFVRDHALPSLVELEAGMQPRSQTAILAALESVLRWHGRGGTPTAGPTSDEPKDLVAAVRDKLPLGTTLFQIVRVAPIAIDPSKTAAEAFDAIGPAADVRREEPHYVGYVLPKKGDARVFEIGKAADIDAQVHRYIDAMASPRSDPSDLGRKLYDAIVAPLEAATPNATQYLIVPDGELALLPIGALSGAKREPLLFRRAVSYLPSAKELLEPPSEASAQPDALFAAPELAKGDGKSPPTPAEAALKIPDVAPLRAEGEAWSKTSGTKDVRYGEAADEAALKAVNSPGSLLLFTHGFVVARDEKLESALARLHEIDAEWDPPEGMITAGVVLAGAKAGGRAGDDGFLTALEATKLNLRATKIVVLTPFDVGTSAPNAGEGLNAVRSAFFAAGAETVVTSLWPGDPTATAALLGHFQKNLGRGLGRAEALRLAQATIAADERTRHPYYWAGFTASGVTAPLTAGKQASAQHDIDALKVHWGGCACEVDPTSASSTPWALALVFGGLILARRRATQRSSSSRL